MTAIFSLGHCQLKYIPYTTWLVCGNVPPFHMYPIFHCTEIRAYKLLKYASYKQFTITICKIRGNCFTFQVVSSLKLISGRKKFECFQNSKAYASNDHSQEKIRTSVILRKI
jgi:hypothetical protein